MRLRQGDFFEKNKKYGPRRYIFGGSQAKKFGHVARPLDRRRPVHLVLKASVARGRMSMRSPRNRLVIDEIVKRWAGKWQVRIHRFENVGNHLHIVATFARREGFRDFLRTITALIARHVTGARPGKTFGEKFWDYLAFTRIIVGRQAYEIMLRYADKNAIEAQHGKAARTAIEQFEQAMRKGRKEWLAAWRLIEQNARNGSS